MQWLALLSLPVVFGCEFLDSISEKKVDINVEGNGLHRSLVLNTKLASLKRFSDCRLLYELVIPSGAYVDVNSVNASLFHHHFYTKHFFDVEASESESTSHKVLITAQDTIRRSFVITDKLVLPIHIRYHSAGDSPARITFQGPAVALDCPDDYEPLKIKSCGGLRRYNDYEPLAKRTVTVEFPVADPKYSTLVAVVTILTLLLSLFIIFSAALSSPSPNQKKEA